MPIMSDATPSANIQTYSAISQCLHWLMAALVLLLLALGWGLEFVHGEIKPVLVGAHKSFGILVFVFFFVRLLARIALPPPPLVNGITVLQKFAAEAAHVGLYTLMLVMPLSGWMAVTAMGRTTSFFDLISLPTPFPKSPELVSLLREIHENGAVFLTGLVVIHVGAALYHHFIRRDETLLRMIPKRFR